MKRFHHRLTHQVTGYGDLGTVHPFCCLEVAPGDSFSGKVGLFARFSPLKFPITQDIYVDQMFFYVPHRMVWDGFEDFLATGPQEGNEVPKVTVTYEKNFPALRYWRPDREENGDYEANALRLRAYNFVYNEYFRQEGATLKNPEDFPYDEADGDDKLYAWPAGAPHNYWTKMQVDLDQGAEHYAPVRNDLGPGQTETGVTADDILFALYQQKIAMKRRTYGTRYIDILRSYGIRVNYQMLQRPEVVAIARGAINITDIVSTTGQTQSEGSDDGFQGFQTGHAVGGQRISIRRKAFPEHGTLLGVLVIRPSVQWYKMNHWLDGRTGFQDYYDPGLLALPPIAAKRTDFRNSQKLGPTLQLGYVPWGDWYRNVPNQFDPHIRDYVMEYSRKDIVDPDNVETVFWSDLWKCHPRRYDRHFYQWNVDRPAEWPTDRPKYGHYQFSAVNRLSALRLLPKARSHVSRNV